MDTFLREAVVVNPVRSLSAAVADHAAQMTGQPTSDLRQVGAATFLTVKLRKHIFVSSLGFVLHDHYM